MDVQKHLSAIIDGRQIRLTEEARKAQVEASAFKKLAKHWPASRSLTSLYHSSTFRELGDVYCSAQVNTREEALEYLSLFNLCPLTYFQGHGFSTIRATDWTKPEMAERYEMEVTDIFPMYWKFSSWAKPLLTAYTMLEDIRISIKVTIKDDPARRIIQLAPDHTIDQWSIEHAPGGEFIKFSGTTDSPGDVQVYFPHEAGGAAPDPAEFLLQYSQPIFWKA